MSIYSSACEYVVHIGWLGTAYLSVLRQNLRQYTDCINMSIDITQGTVEAAVAELNIQLTETRHALAQFSEFEG